MPERLHPPKRDEVVASNEAKIALCNLREVQALSKQIQDLVNKRHRLVEEAKESLHVMQNLRYGGKSWLQEFLSKGVGGTDVTVQEIDDLLFLLEHGKLR
jgi:hypothetical protein